MDQMVPIVPQRSHVQQVMSEATYEAYKARCLATIKAAPPDARCYVQITEDEENRDWQTRAMKELNEEGEFKEYRAYISLPFWVIRT
jgi:hypothetical protein